MSEGPRLPTTPAERRVWGDYLLDVGHTPPWPINEKPTTVKGSVVAAKAAQLMSQIAAANEVLASIDEQRSKAEAQLEAAEKALERIGVTNMYNLTSLGRRREMSVCAEPNCETIDIDSWRDSGEPGWRCDAHQLPKPKPEAMPAEEPL